MELKSWLASANAPESDFPLENLPYGVFASGNEDHIGVAIGDQILDLHGCARAGHLDALPEAILLACSAPRLNPLMALGPSSWSMLRRHMKSLLDAEAASEAQRRVEAHLVPMSGAIMRLPAAIGDYCDFYASIHHATHVGAMFRPTNPLLPNYKYVPIAYHGRASSIIVSGATIRRPRGQIKAATVAEPVFAPTQSLDYELEVGMFVGPGNALGSPIPISKAKEQIFGLCLVNDWSARDIQSWEYQPLGPFLSKSFATSISPWIVPLEALAPYRIPACERSAGDPAPLAYLQSPASKCEGIDLMLEVYLESRQMREGRVAPHPIARSNLRHLYWTVEQMIAHQSSNGCNLRPGDLLATGTVSGPDPGSEGCLLERSSNPEPVRLPSGELRRFLEDGDRVILRAYCQKAGSARIGFGECSGTIASAA